MNIFNKKQFSSRVYQVEHRYAVYGGFGDAVYTKAIVATFMDEDDAKAFVEKFEKPHVYDVPYAELTCGELYVVPIEVISHKDFDADNFDTSNFWWLQTTPLFYADDYTDDEEEDDK